MGELLSVAALLAQIAVVLIGANGSTDLGLSGPMSSSWQQYPDQDKLFEK